jgi:hypothetical protein
VRGFCEIVHFLNKIMADKSKMKRWKLDKENRAFSRAMGREILFY